MSHLSHLSHLDAVYAFLVAMGLATVLTPLAGRLALRVGAVARPSERGLAERTTPVLGGLAIFVGVLVAAAIWMPETIGLPPSLHIAKGASGGTARTWAILVGAAVITIVGAIDDIRELPALGKLVGQIIAAVIVVEGGAVVTGVRIPFIGALQFPNTGGFLTVLWLTCKTRQVDATPQDIQRYMQLQPGAQAAQAKAQQGAQDHQNALDLEEHKGTVRAGVQVVKHILDESKQANQLEPLAVQSLIGSSPAQPAQGAK